MTPPDRASVTWRQASVADCLSVAEVNVRSLRESFAGRSWSPDPGEPSIEQRAAMFRRRFDDPFYRMHVAEAEGQGVVGFVDVGRPREMRWNCDAELYAIYVLKAYQRNGVGRRLFELACDAVQAEGLESMCLTVLQDNPYRKFYESLGGQQVAHQPAGAVPGQDAHVIYAWCDLRQIARRTSFECDPSVIALLGLFAKDQDSDRSDAEDLDEGGWRKFVAEAFRHGIAAMAWDRLRSSDRRRTAPPWALHDLERCSFRTRLDNLRLYGRLAEVLHRFAEQGLPAIVLKGAYLADAIYADRALRGMADVDLLVRRDDLARAAGLLREYGWHQPDAPSGDATADGGHHLSTFVRDGVQVEVHWNIEDERSPFAIDVDALWRRSRSVRIADAPARVLAPEDLLLHVCLHASYNHGWLPFNQGLRPLCDIDACIARFGSDIDWGVFVRCAQEWKAGNCVSLALILARDLVSANVPETSIMRLAPRGIDGRIVRTARRLVLSDYYGDILRSLPVLGRTWLTKPWRHLPRATRWCRHLLPAAKSLATSYPSLPDSGIFLPLHYVAHLRDLVSDLARVAFSRSARTICAHERDRWVLIDWFESPAMGPQQDAPRATFAEPGPSRRGGVV